MAARTLVVVNPQSAGGATGRRLRDLEPDLRSRLGDLEIQRTRGPRDAERIARDALREGVARIVVAGGDGTASEVVSGLLADGGSGACQVGILPMGTGRDLPRTLGVPDDPASAIAALGRGSTREVDAARVSYRDRSGAMRVVYSINVTSFGLGGLTVERVTRAPRLLGGSFAFLFGALDGILRYRCRGVRVVADGREVFDGPLVLGEMSKLALVASLPSLYRGTHVEHPSVSVIRAARIEAHASPEGGEPVWIDVDGEGLGTLPLEIEILPKCVTFFGVASPESQQAERPRLGISAR